MCRSASQDWLATPGAGWQGQLPQSLPGGRPSVASRKRKLASNSQLVFT